MGVFYKGEEIGFIVDSPAKGTLEITENGEYDVSTKAKVVVDVDLGDDTPLTITLPNEFTSANYIYNFQLDSNTLLFSSNQTNIGV